MQLDLSYRHDGDVLFCEVRGPYSLAAFLQPGRSGERSARIGARRQPACWSTSATSPATSRHLDRYRLGIYVAEKPKHAERLAVVARREIINWMFENVATNRGLPTCVTADQRYAENWLRAAA